MTGRRLPAYGRALLDAIKAGLEPAHGISVWIDRQAATKGVCAPLAVFSDTDPADLDWSLCRGRSILIPHADEVSPDRLAATIDAIRTARPARLILLKEESPAFEIVEVG